jgi:hypothetical protein
VILASADREAVTCQTHAAWVARETARVERGSRGAASMKVPAKVSSYVGELNFGGGAIGADA